VEWDYVNTNIIDGLNKNTKPFWKYVKSKHQESGGIAPLKKGTNVLMLLLDLCLLIVFLGPFDQ
jgi:hypothetical protein